MKVGNNSYALQTPPWVVHAKPPELKEPYSNLYFFKLIYFQENLCEESQVYSEKPKNAIDQTGHVGGKNILASYESQTVSYLVEDSDEVFSHLLDCDKL